MNRNFKICVKDTKRLVFLGFFVFFLFCLVVMQFYHLQIIEKDKWYAIACSQHQINVVEYFMRGGFYANTDVKKELVSYVNWVWWFSPN